MFLLDTDHIGVLQRKSAAEFGRLRKRMDQESSADFFLPIVSFHEQVIGWNAYLNRARDAAGVVLAYTMFERVLREFAGSQILPFDQQAAERFELLRRQGIRIGTMDLRIASIALSQDMTLLTRNTVDFDRVPELRVEDWTA